MPLVINIFTIMVCWMHSLPRGVLIEDLYSTPESQVVYKAIVAYVACIVYMQRSNYTRYICNSIALYSSVSVCSRTQTLFAPSKKKLREVSPV